MACGWQVQLQQEAAIFVYLSRATVERNTEATLPWSPLTLYCSTLSTRGDRPKIRNFRGESGTGEAGEAPSVRPVGSPYRARPFLSSKNHCEILYYKWGENCNTKYYNLLQELLSVNYVESA